MRKFTLLTLAFFAAAGSALASDQMLGKSEKEVLRMGYAAWIKLAERKTAGTEPLFQASVFYHKASTNLNDRLLSGKPESQRAKIKKLRFESESLAGLMYEAEQLAIGGGSTFGWGMNHQKTLIAGEALIYSIITTKKYNESLIPASASAKDFMTWKKVIQKRIVESGERTAADCDETLGQVDAAKDRILKATTQFDKAKQDRVQRHINGLGAFWLKLLQN